MKTYIKKNEKLYGGLPSSINGLTVRTYKPVAQAITAKLTVNLMVELIGIEPMTSCLQGRRSPN